MNEDNRSRIACGGSWIFNRGFARADFRAYLLPGASLGGGGFRVVCASPIKHKDKKHERR